MSELFVNSELTHLCNFCSIQMTYTIYTDMKQQYNNDTIRY